MKKLMFAIALVIGPLAYGSSGTAVEQQIEAKLKNDIMTIVNQVNPIDSTTGQRKYISFGFISDIHKCKRVPGDDATTDPVKDYWYGSAGVLTEAEQTIRLLGSVASDAGLDAIINGGDFSTASIMGTAKGLTEEEYIAEIRNVKAMFDEHVAPSGVPFFTVDGNHERCYSLNGALMNMSDATWKGLMKEFNTSAATAQAKGVYVTYHSDLADASLNGGAKGTYTGNTYNLDFRRLYATKGYNVRICCLNSYDTANGSDYPQRIFDAARMYDSDGRPLYGEMTPSNTIMGIVAHGSEEKPSDKSQSVRYASIDLQNGFMNGYDNAGNKVGPWNGGACGKGFFGLVSAHFHFVNEKALSPNVFDTRANPGNEIYASAVSVASAHAVNWPSKPSNHELETEGAYHFSIFIIDTESRKLREVRIGGWSSNPIVHENPVVQLHDFDIRSHLDQSWDEEPAVEALEPVAGDNAPAIQSAIDAAAVTQGTVVLGEGLFEIQSQLMVTGGVTLVGQGHEKTIVKYTGAANTSASRVATVNGGSTLSHLAITGAKVSVAQNAPGAISISDGTITCCCVTNNYSYQGYGGGIGVNGSGSVKIDHTIVADNTAGTVYEGFGGGIGVRADKGLRLEIDACEVRGNKVGNGGSGRNGAGIGISDRNSVTTVIRDTIVTGNVLTGGSSLGGGLHIAQADTTLTGCTVYGNTAATTGDYFGDADMAFPSFGIESAVAAKSSGNAFATGADADLPVFGTVMVVPSAKGVAFSGVVRSPGSDAIACEISLALNGGAAKMIASGVTATFDYDAAGLAPETTYSYTLTLVNNASTAKSVSKSGTFTTRSANDPVQLADYTAYRKYSGTPQSVVLSYYDGPDTRGFAWQTAASVTSGKVWIRKGDYRSADEIVGMPGTVEIDAVSVVRTEYNCTAHKAHTGRLDEGLWSYCLGSGDKAVCGQFTVRSADGAVTAVNVNDIQTKTASRLGCWGNVVDAACAALPSGFDFILSGGDFIDGSSDVGADDYVQWGVVADTARSKFGDAPWIMACGNHESEAYDNGFEIFRELVSEKFDYVSDPEHIGCHAFRQGRVAVLTLPYYDNGAVTRVPGAVETWLAEKLAAAQDADWRIVMLHAGPYTTGDHGPSETFLRQMTPIFATGKVDLVLQAHDHTYSRTLPYRWTGVGYTKDATDSTVLNLAPATTNVAELAGVPFYLDPEGTFYVSAGCAGHRVGEMKDYASGKDVFSFATRAYKLATDTVKVGSAYAAAGSLGSMDVGKPMFAVLKVSGGLLTYDWYVAETDGSATLFDTLRICKTGIAGGSPADPVDPVKLYSEYRDVSGLPQSVMLSYYDGPTTRGFAWQTAKTVTEGTVWLRKGDYSASADIVGKSDTVAITATADENAFCTTYKAVASDLSAGLWSYCLGTADKSVCGKFTVRAEEDGPVVAVNANDIETKTPEGILRWQQTVSAASRVLPADFDLVLSGGDFFHGGMSVANCNDYVEWGVTADVAREKFGDAAWIMALGNHDTVLGSKVVCENYQYTEADHFGGHVFEQGGARILTLPFYVNEGEVPAGVTNWLVSALSAPSDARWNIVMMHASPYTTGKHAASKYFIKQLTPIFAKYKVDLVLQGHDHTYSRTLPYRWTGAGYTQLTSDSVNVNLEPATTNVQGNAGVPFYLHPEGTFYVSAGAAGSDLGGKEAYADRDGEYSYSGNAFKVVTDTVKLGSKYAAAGADGSKDLNMPMFGVLKIDGDLLTYDWYVTETDGSATLFDTLRICKAGEVPVEPPAAAADDLSAYKWAVVGDSLSDPTLENSTDGPLKYYYFLQRDTGIRVTYLSGVGGTGYKNGYDKAADKLADAGCFYQRLEAHPIPSDVDVVTFFGSINDGGFAETDADLGTAADSLTDKTTLAAYMNKAIDLARSQAPNAKILLIGGIYFDSRHAPGHVRLNDMLRQIAALRNQNGDANIAYYDWLTEDPEDPLDFHRITVNRAEEGCFGSLYTYDWKTRGKINESFGHPNPLYNEIWLAPHFGEVLTTALKATLGEVTTEPEVTACTIASTVISLGTAEATAADVYLAYGTDANNLGAATKIATGLAFADPISYTIESLAPGTEYFYELYVTNNAAIVTGSSRTGSFVTRRQASTVGDLGDFAKKVVFTFAAGGQPTLVKISEAISGFRYSDCSANGGDVRFADAEGRVLPFEFVTWNPAGESLVWVKAPAGDGEVAVTMYYSGVPAAANVPSDVWSAYTGVWHFDTLGADDTASSQGTYANSTATEGIDGHLSTYSVPDEAGVVGRSFKVNASKPGYHQAGYEKGGVWVVDSGEGSPLDADGVFTISGWFKHDGTYVYNNVLAKRNDNGNTGDPKGAFFVRMHEQGSDPAIQAYGATSGSVELSAAAEQKANMIDDWVYLTFVYNGKSLSIYQNGELCKSGTIAAATNNDAPLVFGNNTVVADGGDGNGWHGWIDEARYTKGVAMTAAQVSAEYAAMANASFVTAGAAENVDGPIDPPQDPDDPPQDPDDPPPGPTGGEKKVAYTINYNGPAGVSDIPVLVRLAANSPEGFAYADCASDGSDLRFFDADGVALPFEIDTWNTAGESLVWVKAPAVVRDTTFTMTFGGTPAAANTPSATWSGYTGVWHFNELGADTTANSKGVFANSTSVAGIDAHLSVVSTAGEAGRFGSSFRPNDATDYNQGNYNDGGAWVVDTGSDSPLDATNGMLTVSVWIRHRDWARYNNDKIFYKRLNSDNSGDPNGAFLLESASTTGNNGRLLARTSSDGRSRDENYVGPDPREDWVYVTVAYGMNKTRCTLYENGVLIKDNMLVPLVNNDAPLTFGNTITIAESATGAGSYAWNGWIDEARYIRDAKSAEWIAAEYAAMADANFLSAGKVEGSGEESEPPEEPAEIPVYTLTIPAKTGLVVESVMTNDVTITGVAGSYKVASNATVTISFAADGDYEIIGGNPVVITVEGDRTLADGEYPTVRAVEPPPPPPSGDGILPGATPAETRQTIQDAIDAAAPAQGTVTLGEGLFDIDAELFVTNGVTLAGQGRDKTIVRQTNAMKSNEEHRVMTVADGSTVCELTITGGNNDKNYGCGGGVVITAGTISGCCVTNNFSRRYFGGGIYVGEGGNVKIDHTIVSDNSAGTGGLDGAGGGIGIRGKSGAQVMIEACLVYGNTAGGTGRTSPGGGIGVTAKNSAAVVVRNTTVADNAVVGGGVGGGVYVGKGTVTLINCLVAGNTSEATADYGDANVASASAALAPATTTCVIGPATPVFVGDGDYHLAAGSSAIGAGAAYAGIGDDLDGRPFAAATPSVGCYEYQSSKPSGVIMLFR